MSKEYTISSKAFVLKCSKKVTYKLISNSYKKLINSFNNDLKLTTFSNSQKSLKLYIYSCKLIKEFELEFSKCCKLEYTKEAIDILNSNNI